ncbi:hypothetical protein BGZ91_002392 [Linnemannia elongata]|nr:hypothetical protein BGZ91_002392 [Linnemannia elongata]
MSTPSPNTRKVFKTNNNNNRSAGTLATRTQDIRVAPSAAAEGSVNQSHTAAPLPAPEPRSEVLSLDPKISPIAILAREGELISLMAFKQTHNLPKERPLLGLDVEARHARLTHLENEVGEYVRVVEEVLPQILRELDRLEDIEKNKKSD